MNGPGTARWWLTRPGVGMGGDSARSAARFGRLPVQPLIQARILRLMLPADAKVYLALVAHRRGVGDVVWPSYDTLATITGLTRRATIKATRRLVRLGLIRIDRGGGRGVSNHYRIVEAVGNGEPAFTVCSPKRCTGDPETVNAGAPKQCPPVHPKNINEKEREEKNMDSWGLAKRHIACDEFRTARFREAWDGWIRHRRELGKPVSADAAKLQIDKLQAWGIDKAIAAIEESVAAGWTGLFRPRKDTDDTDEPTSGWRYVEPAEEWVKRPYRA